MHFLQRHYIIQLYQITKYDESEENKMEKKGCAIFESQLISAFESEPFTLALLSNTLAVIKPDLMKNGFRDFPVLTLTGKPGSGKTTIARACTPSHIKEYSFTDKVSAVKKELLNITDTYVLLDDFAAFVSHAAREKAYTFLDEVARLSYSGNMPLLIITAEEQALARITGSCKERLLELQVNDVLNDKDLKNILDYLMNKKYLLDKIFSEFAQWYEKNKENYNYKNLLRVFREKNTGKNPRSISLFFAYYTSMIIFCDFAENIYHVTVSKNKIEKTYMKAWEKRTTSTLSREALVQKLFQSLITDQAFSPIKPKEKQICESICYGKCYYSKEFPVDGCSANCSEIMKGFYYDPRDLILQTESSSVILIENAEYLYGYPKYCNTNTPFMIIRDDVLLSFINSELHKLCSENKVHLQPFGAKELHKTLFALNMCMYHYISNKHKTYTFQYHSLSESNVSIMVICLTDYQFKKLAKSARRPIPFYYSQRKVADFCRHLTNMYKTIHGMLGEIGV